MPATPRHDQFDPTVVGVYHLYNRCVRRSFLMGIDDYLGRSFDHRKFWLRDRLRELAASMALDVLDYAVMDNHLHLVVRNRPDIVQLWSDDEVVRRWWQLCPDRRHPDGSVPEPYPCELDPWRDDPAKVAELRMRLSDISWLMRLLCQNLARRANREENLTGKFFENRFGCERILDEAGLLACCIYVDLNPIRAGKAETPETSEFTGAWERIRARFAQVHQELGPTGDSIVHPVPDADDWLAPLLLVEIVDTAQATTTTATTSLLGERSSSVHGTAAAVGTGELDLGGVSSESSPQVKTGVLAALAGANPFPSPRVSNKGFLSLTLKQYLELLDWTGRQLRADKRGAIPASLPPILERLGIRPQRWLDLIGNFRRWFRTAVGRASQMRERAAALGRRWLHGVRPAEQAFD